MKISFDNISKRLVWLCGALFVVSMACFAVQSEDLFMYLAIVREFFKTGSFPLHDPFIYSIPNFSWTILHQWLGYFVFYGLYALGDFDLIIIAKTALITGVFCFPLLRARQSAQATFVWGVTVVVAVLAMSFRMMERTSLFSDLFIVVVLNILMAEQLKPSRWKYFLPLIFLLWVNLHPGFPIGWFLCGVFLTVHWKKWKTPEYRKLAGLLVVSVLVCLINPRGLDGLLYPFNFMGTEGPVYRQFYFEWMPTLSPIFINGPQTVWIFVLSALNLLLLFRARKSKPYFEFFTSAFFIFYGFYAIRFVPSYTFALVTLNVSLALKASYPRWKFKYLNTALAVVILALAVKNIGWGYSTIAGNREFGLGMDPYVVPEKAAKILDQSGMKENIYNAHLFGSYLAWAWEGHRKIFYHGFITDTDFFLHEYLPFGANRNEFDKQVAKYNIGAFLVDRFKGNEGLLNILANHPLWQLVYKDEGSLIFIKKQ